MSKRFIFLYTIFIVLLSVIVNSYYLYVFTKKFIGNVVFDDYSISLISSISLQFSWIVILVWFVIKPYERRFILLITLFSMIISNSLTSYKLYETLFTFNSLVLTIFVLMYGFGFYVLKKG